MVGDSTGRLVPPGVHDGDVFAIGGSFAVESSDPDSSFVVEVGDSVAVRDRTDPSAPCLRGDAVELVEALSIRAPLPDSAPVEWKQLLGGLETAFT